MSVSRSFRLAFGGAVRLVAMQQSEGKNPQFAGGGKGGGGILTAPYRLCKKADQKNKQLQRHSLSPLLMSFSALSSSSGPVDLIRETSGAEEG